MVRGAERHKVERLSLRGNKNCCKELAFDNPYRLALAFASRKPLPLTKGQTFTRIVAVANEDNPSVLFQPKGLHKTAPFTQGSLFIRIKSLISHTPHSFRATAPFIQGSRSQWIVTVANGVNPSCRIFK